MFGMTLYKVIIAEREARQLMLQWRESHLFMSTMHSCLVSSLQVTTFFVLHATIDLPWPYVPNEELRTLTPVPR